MDFVPKILSLAATIYSHFGTVKMNKRQCQRLRSRIEMLMTSVQMMQYMKIPEKQNFISKVLKELEVTLENAESLVGSFTRLGTIKKIVKASGIHDKFEHINDRLNDAAQHLMMILQISISQTQSAFKEETRKEEDLGDREQDEKSLKEFFEVVKEDLPDDCDGSAILEEMKADIKEIKTMMISNADKKAASRPPVLEIREINMNELQKDSRPFLKTDNCTYYKGMFLKHTVAIKRFISESVNVNKVQKIFLREAETMNQFRSNNIVHIYGICMSGEAHKAEFLIVMEYCEHGTLRKVLGSKQPLPWSTRVRMSLDTARGVYWLHQSQEKAKLHCRVSSTSFLVDEDYRVKLAGLELTKTETSIRHNNSRKTDSASTIEYASPQQLNDINYKYDKECEVYSLGIVLWEIASRKTPFEGIDNQSVRRMVLEESFCEPLPDDCPRGLVELIDDCRTFQPFDRPTAGAVVDRLLQIQEQYKPTEEAPSRAQ
ncbi:mixed lineage kinase domain-like protein [Heptranchias perlo]|uniref:mixed lineage kinase domain-like protein n=1 Tax=Heptranchias perlo TaxID=212740 RepID=UPI00355AAF62